MFLVRDKNVFLEIALSSSCLESQWIPLGIMNNVSNSRCEMLWRVQQRLGRYDCGEQEQENCTYLIISVGTSLLCYDHFLIFISHCALRLRCFALISSFLKRHKKPFVGIRPICLSFELLLVWLSEFPRHIFFSQKTLLWSTQPKI